jgi:O-antigen/teichoic acid export membrane protein
MAAIHRITKNTILLVASEIIGKIITFFYIVIAARYLGVSNFGAISFALAFTGTFTVLADIGLSRVQIREIARDKAKAGSITTNILFLKLFLGVATFLTMALIINLMSYPQEIVMLVYIIGLSVLITNFGVSFESVFQGFEEMGYMGIAHILNSLILLIGAVFIANNGAGTVEFALIYLVSSIIIVVFEFFVSIKKFTELGKGVDLKFCKYILKEALPFALSDMFVIAYLRIDNIFLSIFKGENAVGLYSASSTISDSLSLIYFSFMTALFPVTSRLFKYSTEKLMLSFEKSFKYLLVMSIPIAVGTTVLSDKIIRLVYGAEYTNSAVALQILVWSASLIFMSTAVSNLLSSIDKQVIVTKQRAIATFINLVANLILIPSYSYIGASIAAVITQLFSVIYLYLAVSKTEFKLPKKTFLTLLSKVIVASVLMGIFTAYLRPLNIFLIVPLSAILYFFSFYLIGGIDGYDIELAKNMISGFLNIKIND